MAVYESRTLGSTFTAGDLFEYYTHSFRNLLRSRTLPSAFLQFQSLGQNVIGYHELTRQRVSIDPVRWASEISKSFRLLDRHPSVHS